MAELNYDDFKRRVNIQDLLIDAGYSLNRRDGLRYPSYVWMGSDGKRVRGDKFIVTANGLCCFQPPEQKNYNVISFIKEHPNLFADYTPGMNTDRLVNLVCNRLLNNPIMDRSYVNLGREHIQKPFNINDYERVDFRLNAFDSQKPFYPYFKTRGINLDTQKAFHNNFFIAMKEAKNGKTHANLSFPLRKPSDLATIVGLEERSRATKTGKTIYKGMAAGSDATNGLWIAAPAETALDKVKDVYWFESAYDAMSYYQIMKDKALATKETNPNESKRTIEALDKSCFVSTAGNPSVHQYKGMMNQTENANHHLCFDRDRAGRMFAFNFLVAKDNANYRTSQPEQGVMVIDDRGEKYYTDITREDFSLEETIEHLNLNMLMKPNDLTDYMKTLRKEDDLMSGDMGYLHGKTSKEYNLYESLAEEYSSVSGPFSIPLCEEDLASMRKEMNKTYKDFKESFDKSYKEYQLSPKVIYEPCAPDYKDWNDQLLDKKQYSSENIIESAIDGIEGEYTEQKDGHEEDRKENNEESEQIEQKHHFRR